MSIQAEDVILVLGGRSEIGLAIARRFAADGFAVQLAVRTPDLLQTDMGDIALRHGVDVTAHRYDACDLESAESFLAGLPVPPRVIVAAVGWLGDQDETAQNPISARRAVETNFLGPGWALEAGCRHLATLSGDTAAIGISSVAGDRGRAANYWYGAAKAGFTALLSGLRQKYSRSHVAVLTVKPGFVATRMTDGMDLPPALTATPQEVAEGVHKAWRRRRDVVYVPAKWRLIMTVITLLPEILFKKTRF